MNQLEALKSFSTVVADTGDFNQLATFTPQDATTNPSLILKAVQSPEYKHLLREVASRYRAEELDETVDRLLVRFGCEILSIVPGRVSTEVDARLSFDTAATVARGERLAKLYKSEGIPIERVLIKVAATWEGIQAAEQLQRNGIRTNMTLLFALCQAISCAQAKVQLISPFVGRIYDWHKKHAGQNWVDSEHVGSNDPGVKSVRSIYNYYRTFGISTEVMAASFRNVNQIIALAGCDLLTISPDLLSALSAANDPIHVALGHESANLTSQERIVYSEVSFRFAMNEDAMATEKLAEGIRGFCSDANKLDQLLMQAKR